MGSEWDSNSELVDPKSNTVTTTPQGPMSRNQCKKDQFQPHYHLVTTMLITLLLLVKLNVPKLFDVIDTLIKSLFVMTSVIWIGLLSMIVRMLMRPQPISTFYSCRLSIITATKTHSCAQNILDNFRIFNYGW